MKMVKSLLLGSAAGVVAVTAGQAADLPVKAKPVEYVKVCSLYGAGFYYMPGTDLCIKIGGWMRFEASDMSNGSLTWGTYNGATNQRTTSNLTLRARGYITADVRNQTAYGTARAYLAVGLSTNDVGLNTAANQFSANRAFVQWAGFTAGITQSFYDYYSVPAATYSGGYFPASDTGDPGWLVFAYTAQFGNGFSATLAEEERRITQIIDQNSAQPGAGFTGAGGTIVPGSYFNALTTNAVTAAGVAADATGAAAILPSDGAYGGMQMGDVVANLRLDQAWGGGQIMGALHEVNASYYSAANAAGSNPGVNNGHPGDDWGFAVGAGLKINFPTIAPGDYFQSQVNYTQGALRYVFFTPNTNWGALAGNKEAYGVMSDAVYGGTIGTGTATSLQLTTGWNVNASYEHYWTPQWHQSLFGGYGAVSYNSTANAMLCQVAGFGAGFGSGAAATGSCNNNWQTWWVGSRLQWDITKTFYLGVEGLYQDLQSATPAAGAGGAIGGYTFGSATAQEANQGSWTVRVRMHRDFLP